MEEFGISPEAPQARIGFRGTTTLLKRAAEKYRVPILEIRYLTGEVPPGRESYLIGIFPIRWARFKADWGRLQKVAAYISKKSKAPVSLSYQEIFEGGEML